MEFFIGSVTTFVMIMIVAKAIRNDLKTTKLKNLKYNQSSTFEQVKDFLPDNLFKMPKMPETQLSKHHKSMSVKIVFTGEEAYWIQDNIFYVAQVVDGMIDQDSKKTVDTMGMDKIQLDKISFIVDRLTEEL